VVVKCIAFFQEDNLWSVAQSEQTPIIETMFLLVFSNLAHL
jgi:hypothetical protein